MLKKIDSLHSTPSEEESKTARLQRVASVFLEEKSRLGPIMFIPGRVLHLEEEKEDEEEEGGRVTRYIGLHLSSFLPALLSPSLHLTHADGVD